IRSRNTTVLLSLVVATALFCVARIVIMQKMNRRFLCSTAWAREQNLTPEKLPLFSFASRAATNPRNDNGTAPRFSRTAIIGACWAALSIITIVMAKSMALSDIGHSWLWRVLALLDQ